VSLRGARFLGIKLAEFNGSQSVDMSTLSVWEKAAQYIMSFMAYLKLVDIKALTVIEYYLTSEGEDFVKNLPPGPNSSFYRSMM
jgi:hypothetical protein